jgi:hypothetical protein
MRLRAYKFVACALVALFVSSVAAPGLRLHNCRQFGTKSTQLCACCEAEVEAAASCCAKKSQPVAPACHESAAPSIESSCCFVSYEGPFSFEGQSSSQVSAPTAQHYDLLASQHAIVSDIAPVCESLPTIAGDNSRHSSDPPPYILTHSFRC